MASYSSYSIPLIRSDGEVQAVETVKEGGKFLFVFTGDLAGATLDLSVKYEAHPEPVIMLGMEAPEKNSTEVWLPVGTEVSLALMGGSPTSVNATLILVV